MNRPNHNKQVGFFVADTFKVTPKLTLDYGLRWDYYGIATYDDGLMYNFDLASGKVIVPQRRSPRSIRCIRRTFRSPTGQVVPNAALATSGRASRRPTA